jgi:hypothetical protein
LHLIFCRIVHTCDGKTSRRNTAPRPRSSNSVTSRIANTEH